MKPASKKGKDKKKKKGGTDALAAAFAALEVQPEEEAAETPEALPEADANGSIDIEQHPGGDYNLTCWAASARCTATLHSFMLRLTCICSSIDGCLEVPVVAEKYASPGYPCRPCIVILNTSLRSSKLAYTTAFNIPGTALESQAEANTIQSGNKKLIPLF